MAKFSNEERAAAIAEARETVERIERLESERMADDNVIRFSPREDWVVRWKREAAAQQERRPMPRNLTETEAARLENKLTGMVGEQRQLVLEIVAEALGEFRDDLVDEINGCFVEMRKEIAELRKARGVNDDDDKGGIIDLPNALASRRLQ